jgi:Fe-S-cluster containining protein
MGACALLRHSRARVLRRGVVTDESANPCLSCGACCAAFRVSFYWAEAPANGLPESLYEAISPTRAAMRGTNCPAPRCAALAGDVGGETRCLVYESRPSPCREVAPGDEKCRRARALRGLPALCV